MEILFGLYALTLCAVFFIGFMIIKNAHKNKTNSVDRIADLQKWEFLRSFTKDGNK